MTEVLFYIKNLIGELDDEAETKIVRKGEEGSDRDTLYILERSFGSISNIAEAEYYFLDEEEAGTAFFVGRVYMIQNVFPENGAELCLAISLINEKLVGGCIGYDPEENCVIYDLSVPLVSGSTKEQIRSVAESTIAASLSESRNYAGELLLVAKKRGE